MNELTRANKVTVTATATGFEAKFARTHKDILTVNSAETGFVADINHNKTLQREMFRTWVCENATAYGIDWDPSDKRASTNVRFPKYTDDTLLEIDAEKLVSGPISDFTAGCKIDGLVLDGLTVDGIVPMEKSGKGTDLSTLGILDGKYANGNWAWAEVQVTAELSYKEQKAFILMTLQLVSGQIKKPSNIGDGGFNQTSFKSEVLAQIKIAEEIKESSSETVTEEAEITESSEPVVTETKKSKKLSK